LGAKGSASADTPKFFLWASTINALKDAWGVVIGERVHFRLVRGPGPYVVEQFHLRESGERTELEYSGELGTDLWAIGSSWGALVAPRWEAAVRSSVAAIQAEAERRAARR